jgi:hypothetical protein
MSHNRPFFIRKMSYSQIEGKVFELQTKKRTFAADLAMLPDSLF